MSGPTQLRSLPFSCGRDAIARQLRGAFDCFDCAKKRGWTLVQELSTYSGGKRVVPDGTVRDEFRLAMDEFKSRRIWLPPTSR